MAAASLLAAGGFAGCGNLIGLDEWDEPTPTEDAGSEDDGSGGGGGQASGSASSGSGATSGSGGGGGVPAQDPGPECNGCIQDNCNNPTAPPAPIEDCAKDSSCAPFVDCLYNPEYCCQELKYGPAPAKAQAAYDCIHTKCEMECLLLPGAQCADCFKNGPESDIDCGTDVCKPCANGKNCNTDGDCQSLNCVGASDAGTGQCM